MSHKCCSHWQKWLKKYGHVAVSGKMQILNSRFSIYFSFYKIEGYRPKYFTVALFAK